MGAVQKAQAGTPEIGIDFSKYVDIAVSHVSAYQSFETVESVMSRALATGVRTGIISMFTVHEQ